MSGVGRLIDARQRLGLARLHLELHLAQIQGMTRAPGFPRQISVERAGDVGRAPVKLLLDTHIWLWSHVEPERLTKRVMTVLADAGTELWLSPISVWEFLLLAEHGRVGVRPGSAPVDWVEAARARAPMHDAPLTREVAVRSRTVRLEHEDPADRFLAATAEV
jgi:PIN domain nuclease of toxin-antitoxin system